MATREPLTVAVITLDEERSLARCLRSVSWAEEIVVVDSGSTDGTVAVAESHGARVLRRDFDGYVDQKNFAVDQATHRWVLSLDADEWLSPEAADEVRRVLERPAAEGYAFNRRTKFAGVFLDHVWSSDWQLRLFRRDRGRFAGGRVHESVRLGTGGREARLRQRLLHDGYASIDDYVERANRYTDLAALSLVDRGQRSSTARLVLSPVAALFKFLVLRRGFLDGLGGIVVAVGSAFYVLLKQAKLRELESSPGDRHPSVQ